MEKRTAWTDGEKALQELFPDQSSLLDWTPKAIKAFDDLMPEIEKFFKNKKVPREEKKKLFFKYNLTRFDVKHGKDRNQFAEAYKDILSTINKEEYQCH